MGAGIRRHPYFGHENIPQVNYSSEIWLYGQDELNVNCCRKKAVPNILRVFTGAMKPSNAKSSISSALQGEAKKCRKRY